MKSKSLQYSEAHLPDEEVKVKMSVCQKCNGWVTVAVSHTQSNKSKREMAREAIDYNLSIREVPLIEFRASKMGMCECTI